ncbi:DUF3488 and transglutaminase-like domain-containing protein [Plantibacter flavus]|uniref:DUF3488 and transglutaminase-like domain-containing protein n=1 Tax=Plantibacter flavus TaxID=150123 RepID=UPI000A1C9335|nr:transglutaminase domain-containing protein [Plantibacter flavus]
MWTIVVRRLPVLGVFLAALGFAMLPLWSTFGTAAFPLACGGGLLLGAAVAVVGLVLRLAWWSLPVLGALAFLGFGVPFAVPSASVLGVLPSWDGERQLIEAVVVSWKQLLTIEPPFGEYGALLVPPFLLLLAVAGVGVTILLRPARYAGWLGLLPVTVLGFAIAFGSGRPFLPAVSAVGVTVCVLLLVGMTTDRRPRTAGSRRFWPAVALLAVCASVGVVLHPPVGHRDVLREVVEPPVSLERTVSPLAAFRAEVVAPGADRERFTVSGLPGGARIRTAALDRYDGQVFTAGGGATGDFARVPSTLPGQTGERSVTADVAITVREGTGLWLPMPGALRSIAFSGSDARRAADSFAYDRRSSTAVVTSGVRSGLGYRVSVLIGDESEADALDDVTPGPATQTELTGLPEALLDAAARRTDPADPPGVRLATLVDWLRSGYVSHGASGEPDSRAGHSAERLDRLVTASPMLGDEEQYAAALTILARGLGFPSRVVVGFRPEGDRRTVTGADSTVWTEVQIQDGRWIVLDPTPEPRPVPEQTETSRESVAHPQTVLPPPAPDRDQSPPGPGDEDGDVPEVPPAPAWLTLLLAVGTIVGWGLGAMLLLTSPVWGLALARALRRRARHRSDLRRTVLTGAWRELEDAAADRGIVTVRGATRLELASTTGGEAVLTLAELVDRTVFGATAPDSQAVDRAWQQLAAALAEVDTGSRGQRWRRRLRPGSLVTGLRRTWSVFATRHRATTPCGGTTDEMEVTG